MRILHVLEPVDGGVPVHVRDLSGALVERGHEIDAIVSDGCELIGDLQAAGVDVATVPFASEMVAPAADLRSLRRLAATLRARRWDVVHTHGNKAGSLARPPASALGLPVVHTTHGYAYTNQRFRPRAGMELRRTLTLNAERALSPFADVIVCVSEADRQESIRDRVAGPDRFVAVHHGIPEPVRAAPDPRLAELGGEGPVIGFLARLHEQKAPLLLVEALVRLRDRGVEFRAALVGNGPLEDEVRAAVAQAGLANQVAVLPFEGRPEAVLGAFDLYVLPSLWESLGISALEAMAAGLPVVASDVGGLPEVVADGETGVLVPPSDPEALSRALERLLGDREARRRMGEAGRARRAQHFTLPAMAEKTEAVYELARERRLARASS